MNTEWIQITVCTCIIIRWATFYTILFSSRPMLANHFTYNSKFDETKMFLQGTILHNYFEFCSLMKQKWQNQEIIGKYFPDYSL